MPETRRPTRRLPLPRTRVEYLIPADAVEAFGGKLYLMGGGWDQMYILDLARPAPLSLALGVVVPWNETDEDHVLTLSIDDPENRPIENPFTLTFRTGRSPTMERGADSHVPFAVKGEFTFPSYATYTIRAAIDGRVDEAKATAFTVRPAPGRLGPDPAERGRG